MRAETERTCLQVAVAVASMVPILAGIAGVVEGPAFVRGVEASPTDLDSHFRYLSGLLLGIGLAFVTCIPRIERAAVLFRALALIVFLGGIGRLLSAVLLGLPGGGHMFGLAMELGVVPLLALWQGRVARRSAAKD